MARRRIPGQYFTGRKHLRRTYAYRPTDKRLRILATLLLAGLVVFSAWQLIAYGLDLRASRQASEALREAYHQTTAEPTAAPSPTPTIAPTLPPEATAIPTATPPAFLDALPYPDNPRARISSRFQSIRRQNEDIIGWLTIADVLDEAVVQRDNTYYLRRDYRGYHNVNGALFLDASISLATRPHTLTIYGHNMKTGAMFGSLRNYENLAYYRRNPFITFDTIYEQGRYVIFAVAELSLDASRPGYFNFAQAHSDHIASRQSAIDTLQNASRYACPIDVQPTDQLLLLVTCVDDDADRRILAARRLRPGETEAALMARVNDSHGW